MMKYYINVPKDTYRAITGRRLPNKRRLQKKLKTSGIYDWLNQHILKKKKASTTWTVDDEREALCEALYYLVLKFKEM